MVRIFWNSLMKATMHRASRIALFLVSLGWQVVTATTVSPWEPAFKGIDYATATNSAVESPGPLKVFVMRISLNTPGISFATTASSSASYPGFETFSQTTGNYVNSVGAKVGINANFFSVVSGTAQPQNLTGLAVSNGFVVSQPETNFPALLLTQGNVASLATTPPSYDLSGVWNAVAGSSFILQNGVAITPPAGTAGDPFNPNPRSAIGISQDGSYLYMMVVDGRTSVSVGCTQAQTGEFLAMFGAYNGINLDGGGSSTLVKYVGPGVVYPLNSPSGGSQRLNGNNLAVFADPLPVPPVPVLPYSPAIAANNPAAFYHFNETAGTTAADASGNARNGTYPASGVTKGVADQPIKSEPGTSATFNGAAGTHVTVPYASALNAGSFTVEAWAKPTTTTNAFQGIVSSRDDKGSGPAGNGGYVLYLGPATGDGGLPRWQFWTGGTTTATYTALGRNNATGFGLGPAASINSWTHVVGTFNATSGPDGTGRYNGTQSLYVNGALVISLANVNYLPNPNKSLYIGAGTNESPPLDNFRFTGGIDEVAIYNNALTAARVQAHYQSGITTLSAPAIALASPLNGSTYPFGTTINLIANSSDSDGSVAKVEFFDGPNKLGEVTAAPFTFAWSGATPGVHEITLRATDDSTLTTTSASTAITVGPANTVTIAATDPSAGEFGADQSLEFTVTRTGPTTHSLTVPLVASGSASVADYSGFVSSVIIPINQASLVLPLTAVADNLAEGPETVTLSLAASPDFIAGSPASASAVIADKPAQGFYFNNIADAAKRAPTMDADDDGKVNIIEYFMGTLPSDASSNGVLTIPSTGVNTFKVRYPRAKNRPDVSGILSWSSDLTNWHPGGQSNGTYSVTFAEAVVSATEANPETVEATATITGPGQAPQIFVRLGVE